LLGINVDGAFISPNLLAHFIRRSEKAFFKMNPIDRRYLDFSPQTHGLSLDMTGAG